MSQAVRDADDPQMDERAKRIVDTAIALAERDGYSAVRLRDVAATAEVALGTVYKRFSSKEEILLTALEQEFDKMWQRLSKQPAAGTTPQARVQEVFGAVTKGLLRRPNLARALVRSVSSGDPKLTERVASFHAGTTALIVAALRGEAASDHEPQATSASERERNMASVLQQVWFAALVGWAGGVHDAPYVLDYVRIAADLVIA